MKNNRSVSTPFTRRKFLSRAAMGALGYNLMVSLPASGSPSATKRTVFPVEALKKDENGLPKKSLFAEEFKAAQPSMKNEKIECDVLVAGGGMSGLCAALAAARSGAKTVLVHNRSRLGGCASSELKMHAQGVDSEKVGFREGGILEELKLENAAENPDRNWDVWDFMFYDKCVKEPNLTLLLDTTVFGADTSAGKITAAYARCDYSMTMYEIRSKTYIDCTGDGRLAIEAGAEMMSGREGPEVFGESLAGIFPRGKFLGCSVIFTSRDAGHPVKYKAPEWAEKITAEDLKFRDPRAAGFNWGYWFISFGGMIDPVHDLEPIRRRLLSITYGVWDYIKNSGRYPEADNLALDFIGMLPGRRDSYRIKGFDVFTQRDIDGDWKKRPDQIALAGWKMEDQPSLGFDAKDVPPSIYGGKTMFYNIPFRMLYSKDFSNLLMAGRNMNASHMAFTSTRVINTGAVAGEAAGTAAAICAREKISPNDIAVNPSRLKELQQLLLKNGNTIVYVKNEDPQDIAISAKASATASASGTSPQNALNGYNYDFLGETKNRWMADISKRPSLKIEWDSPQKISRAVVNLDAGSRIVTQSIENAMIKRTLQAPQPEVLKDFDLVAILPDGSEKKLFEVRGNYQKFLKYGFEPLKAKALRLDCLATNGSPTASVFEIRAYA